MLSPAAGGKNGVRIDRKLDLHDSLRQAMPHDLLNISQAALQVTALISLPL